jgi:formylglycine-generating enzyme required for sulfatase activity
MNRRSSLHRSLTVLFLLAFGFSLPGPLSLVPSVEAASSSASARIIKKLKKQIATLKAQLAAATTPPTPAAFIEMVTVGNAGNAADTTTFGAVPYEFKIGKTELTLAQYTAFLNAVAATDAFGLFNASMETDNKIKGIAQSGSSGSFTYSVIGDGSRPVTYVSWFDAARFCNWLHNGRPTGPQTAATTERGAYTLDGAVAGVSFSRQWGAKFWIPSEDEWYKAAYHQPADDGGDGDNYWLYPTKSNAAPTAEAPPGGANSANFNSVVDALTPVGAYTGSAGFYGTFDQGGNVWEWNDAVISGSFRGLRGGSWFLADLILRSSFRDTGNPGFENNFVGFRVASP